MPLFDVTLEQDQPQGTSIDSHDSDKREPVPDDFGSNVEYLESIGVVRALTKATAKELQMLDQVFEVRTWIRGHLTPQ